MSMKQLNVSRLPTLGRTRDTTGFSRVEHQLFHYNSQLIILETPQALASWSLNFCTAAESLEWWKAFVVKKLRLHAVEAGGVFGV